MRILVTGASGFVGAGICRYLARRGRRIVGTGRRIQSSDPHLEYIATDLTELVSTQELLARVQPSVIIHAAGDKDVKRCEKDPALARLANVATTQNLLEASEKFGSRILYLSTDLVFAGTRGNYSESDTPSPPTVYGQSKLAAEQLVLAQPNHAVLRTAGVFGQGSPVLAWLLAELRAGRSVDCFTDVINSPTYLPDLAQAADLLLESQESGLFHIAGPDPLHRHGLFRNVALAYGLLETLLRPIEIGDRRQSLLLAPNSSLDSSRSLSRLRMRVRPVRDALEELVRESK
jgi:dTDP-4-dehydrorhamnose reductase